MGRKKHKNLHKQKKNPWPFIFSVLAAFCLLLLPVIRDNRAMDITLYPRLLALYGFLIVLTVLFFRKSLWSQLSLEILKDPLFLVSAVFLVLTGVSMAFATNVSAGFFDLAKTFASLLLMAYMVLIFLNTPDWPSRLARFFVLSTLISLSLGYYQYLFKLGFGFHDRWMLIKVNGLMSNVNLYANYLMMMFPLLIFGVIRLRNTWRGLAVIAMVLNFFMVFLLQTRAVYVGLMLGVPAAVLVLLWHYRQFNLGLRWRNRLAVACLLLALIGGGMHVAVPSENIYRQRVQSIFTDRENPRLLIWDISIKMVSEHPITGVGAGNFAIRVQEYYGRIDIGQWAINWLRPHNDFLWVAVEKGVPGLFIYVAFFMLALLKALRVIRQNDPTQETNRQDRWLPLLLLMGLVSYMVNAVFDFPYERINHQVVLSVYVACLLALSVKQNSDQTAVNTKSRMWLLPLLGLLCLGAIYSFKGLQQEHHVMQARKSEAFRNWDEMLLASKQAQTPWRTLDALAVPVHFFEGYAQMQLGDYEKALKAFEVARQQNPYRRYILQNLGLLYNHFNQYDDTIEVVEKLLVVYELNDLAARLLGEAYYHQGRHADALGIFEAVPDSIRSEVTRSNITHIHELMDDIARGDTIL